MIKQNIKIAILAICIALGLWAIASAFIKIDYSTQTLISFATEQPTILVESKISAYIENNNIERVKVEYESQYFECRIMYESQSQDLTSYTVFLPVIIPRTTSYLQTNIIIDSLNVYQYIFKK